jgi:hypothetical protein
MLRSAAALSLVLTSASALASSSFPATVQSHLTLSTTPDCSLCHANGLTGTGTVKTRFGVSLLQAGAVGGDTARLIAALDTMAAAGVDSDCDGVGDIQELKAGTDPNAPPGSDGGVLTSADGGVCGQVILLGPPVTFGCSASAASGLLGVLGVLVLARRRSARTGA